MESLITASRVRARQTTQVRALVAECTRPVPVRAAPAKQPRAELVARSVGKIINLKYATNTSSVDKVSLRRGWQMKAASRLGQLLDCR